MRKLIRLITMLTILFSIFFGMGSRVGAESADTITFTLHKLVFPENKMPDPTLNDGDERLTDYDGLNGVTFDVYDVTSDFYCLLNESDDKEAKEVQSELQNMDVSNHKSIAQQITATIGTADGVANFHLPKISDGKDAVYLFRETAAPSDVKSKAVDMIVALPVLDTAGDILEGPIHLYPKNEIVTPQFEKRIIDQQPSYQLGDQIRYELTTKLPSNLSMYSKYLISDQADESLVLDDRSIRVHFLDETYNGYQLETSEHGFRLIFDLAKLKPYVGKEITISYAMALKNATKVDQAIINRAKLETDFDKIEREKKVKTSGKKFIKVDAINKEQTLEKAVFVVKNSKGEYLRGGENEFHWTPKKEDTELVKLTSNKKGHFEIKGLRYGSYSLKEVSAPSGYYLSEKEIPFDVSENSYSFSEGILQVINQKAPPTNKQTYPSPTQTKKQFAAGSLDQYPKMNDTRNVLFVLIGVSLVVLAVKLTIQHKIKRSE
ncbi:SpaH/EbpB family LPXTG-anchored major pilin [Enterococcus sp. AZ196]|uniref:SpaH/EbpB family LPXTG-anchored major pilin n=1 Tax=Enterococcus sp. AZ196 TaxID=2774659 RepID=UPI003D2BAB26